MENKNNILKVKDYFDNTQYENTNYGNIQKFVIKPIDAEATTNVVLQPYYNPLKKAINNLAALSLKNIEPKKKNVIEQWKKDNYYLALPKIIREMILDKCFLEIIKNADEIHYQIHKNEAVDSVEYNGSKILEFIISGEIRQYNEDNEIETISIQKIYRNKKGTFELELSVGEETTTTILDYIPIFEFSFSQDYSGLLIKVDLVNELLSEIRAIINLHSSPIQFAKNLGQAKNNTQHDSTSTDTQTSNVIAKLWKRVTEDTHKKKRMISVEENEVGKSADIKYIELSNTWVNEIIATITNITEQIKSEYPEIELNLTNSQVSTTTQVIQLQEIRSKVSLLRNNFLNVQSKIDSTALKLKLTSEDYFYSDLFEEIETQKELENEKLQAEIQSIKINNIKILNEIQTNEELLKLVDEELNKTVGEVVDNEEKGD